MSPDETKPWWKSTTIWSGIGSVLIAALGVFTGSQASGQDVVDGATSAGQIAAGVLGLLVIWGRMRAGKRIG